jgi:hypothetical protein
VIIEASCFEEILADQGGSQRLLPADFRNGRRRNNQQLLQVVCVLKQEAAMSVTTALQSATRKIGSMISGSSSEPEILDTLKQEHEDVAEMLKKLVDSNSGAARKNLVAKIKASLLPHIEVEQTILYDAMITVGDKKIKQDGKEGYIEHELAALTLAKLESISNAMSPEFGAAAKVLKELVEHHVQEEEKNVWADAKEKFSAEERVAMNHRYLAAKTRVGEVGRKAGSAHAKKVGVPRAKTVTVAQPKKAIASPKAASANVKRSVAAKRSRANAGAAS